MVERISLCSLFALITMPFAAWSVEARATNSRSVAQNTAKPTKPRTVERPTTEVDRESEVAATQLVDSHLPELKSVLKHLKADNPRQYNVAIRDLAKSARRLELAQKRDEELYSLEVDLLQAQSSVRLLTAKLKVRDQQQDRKRLRQAVSRLQLAELNRAKYEVRVLQERVERSQKSLDAAKTRLTSKESKFEQQLEASYLAYLRKAGRDPTSEPADKKKTPTSKN